MAQAATTAGGAPALPSADTDTDQPTLRAEYYVLVVIGLMLANILPLIDTTIANVAIPHMQSALGATPESVMWVLTSYIIAHAVAIPLTGWLADRFGSRQLFIASTVAFVVTSMLCGIAQNLEEMVLFRILQGIAGAFIMPLSQSILLDITRPSRHASIMAIWSLGVVVGPIVGPLLGGWITENIDWRWVFFINVPLGIIALFILYFTLPGHPKRRRRFDLTGFILLGLSLAALQFLLDRGHQVDWFDALECWIYLGVCLCSFWMAIVHLSTAKDPLFDRALFADINFLVAFIFMLLVGTVIYSTAALLAPMLQNLFGYTAYDTGVVIAPRGIGAMMAMQMANRMLSYKIDPRVPITIGFICVIWSLYAMAQWSLETTQFEFLWTGVVQGLGVGFITLPIYIVAFATLAPHLRTDGSGLLNLSRLIGSSMSISVVTALFARSVQVSHADLGAHINQSTMSYINPTLSAQYQEFGESALAMLDMEINRQAAMIGYINDFWLVMWASIITMPLILMVRKASPVSNP